MEQMMMEFAKHKYLIHPVHYTDNDPSPMDYIFKTEESPKAKFYSKILSLEFQVRNVNKDESGEAVVRSVAEKFFDKERIQVFPHTFYYMVIVTFPLCHTMKVALRKIKADNFLNHLKIQELLDGKNL